MHITTRSITSTQAMQRLLSCLLAVALVGLAAGCGGAGANEDGDGNGEGDDPGTSAPAAPSNLSGTSLDGTVELSWDAVDADDVEGYNVYRDTESIGDVEGREPVNGSALAETGYADEAAENGTTYYYVVTTVDADENESDPSNEVEKTPFSDPPDRP